MIMPISTSGIGNLDVSSTTASKAKTKAEEKAADAFASLMNMVTPDSKDVQTEIVSGEIKPAGSDEISQAKDAVNTDNTYDSDKTYDVSNDKCKSGEVEDESKVDVKSTETSKVDGEITKTEDKQELLNDAAMVLSELVNMITEELDITVEELEGMLNDMNLSLDDLLDVSNLKSFILNYEGCTNVDLLINENLADMVNNVCDKLEDLLTEHNITDAADLAEFIQSNSTEIYQIVETDTTDINVVEINDEVSNQDDILHIKDSEDESNTNIMDLSEEAANVENDVDNLKGNRSYNSDGYKNNHENAQNTLVNNLNQAVNNAFSANGLDGVISYTNGVQEADIVRQIIDEIKVNLTKETTSMEVSLNPESLGKVQINVSSKDGIISAQIVAENEAAKHAIENSISVLKEAFNNQELKVDAVEVMIASYEFFNKEQNSSFNEDDKSGTTKNNNGINLNEISEDESLSEAEQLQVEIMRQNGSSVSYSI